MTKDPMEALQTAVDVAQMKGATVLPPPPVTRKRLQPGDFFEVMGVCYEITKISHKGTVFCKPFTGRLTVPRGTATATQLQGARKVHG